MLQIKNWRSDIRLEQAELLQVLVSLSEAGWKPVLLESQKRILELAGVVGQVSLPISGPPSPYGPNIPGDALGGDVFFRDADVYFLLSQHGDTDMRYRRSYALYGVVSESETGIEVGIITSDGGDADQRLQAFADAFQQATMGSLDGRKTRHMQFAWQPSVAGTPRLDAIMSGESGESNARFGRPEIDDTNLRAAKALSNERTRAMLIELSQAGFTRAQDVLSRKGKKQEEAEKAIAELKSLGMLTVEYLLECKRAGLPLTRLAQKDQLDNPTIGDLRCAMCNKPYREENLSEGYSPSDLGRSLCNSSHWMTVWITDELRNAGVPTSAIIWNLSQAGEEVDLLVEFMGEVWILELKDREFGSGDAHPLNYRQVRYKATKAIVVTTDKVSKDARRVFDDLAKERSNRGGSPYLHRRAGVCA
jgi:hypothetical protein